MSIERFFTTAVTIVKPGSTLNERYNRYDPNWDSPLSSVETSGWLTQVSSNEDVGARNVVVTGWKLYLAASESIAAGDRVIAGGSFYAVDGDPHHAQTPAGQHHIEAFLTYVAEIEPEVVS